MSQPLLASLLHDVVEIQTLRTPHAVAAISATATITYEQLSQRSDRLAATLQQMGAKPDTLIGLCVERSADMLVALLGILKSGAAYVPLDPKYPQDRLAFMTANADCKIIVAEQKTRSSIPTDTADFLFIDTFDDTKNIAPLQAYSDPQHLAYTMYTSGSTGQPKGVMIEHRNIVPFITWTQQRFSPNAFRYTLCANSLSFDVSIFEIFATLAVGGTLIIVQNILDLIVAPPSHPISAIIAAPSSLAEIVRAQAIPESIDTLIFGGERLPIQLVQQLYATTSVAHIVNSWGVTEDSIGSAFIDIPRTQEIDPPVGRVIEGRHLYLLDAAQQPVAIGTPGELYCGGYGVARGYVQRPELNAERFLSNPFGDSPTMYRTGDLAVQGEDGTFRFLGRNDQQIKMHGFRIELGEIESVINAYPGIAQSAVIAHTQVGRLDMFLVSQREQQPTLAELQAFLIDRLPTHMIPSTLTYVDKLPVGPTGKLDRSALAMLAQQHVQHYEASDEPMHPIEKKIVELYAEILGIPNVGLYDNFFALGGKSLLAARLGTEIRQAFPEHVAKLEAASGSMALHTAFAVEPTPRSLAIFLLQKEPIPKRHESLYCIQPGSASKPPLFLFHGVINGEAFYSYDLAHALGPEQPLYALAPHGLDGSEVPETVEEMASDYLARIRLIQPEGPYHFMGYCNGGLVAFEAAQQLRQQSQNVETLVLIATPAHNVRHRLLKVGIDICDRLLGPDGQRRLRWFLATVDHARLLKYHWEYTNHSIRAALQGKQNTAPSPRNRIQKSRRIEPQAAERPSFRHIVKAVQAYVPQRYQGTICIVWGKDDEYLQYHDPREDWKRITSSLHVDFVAGDHHFLSTSSERLLAHFPHK